MNEMGASTNRPGWTQTLFQGMGNGLNAFKHKIVHRSGQRGEKETVLLKDFDWTANANSVKVGG